MKPSIKWAYLGRVAYPSGLSHQRRLWKEVQKRETEKRGFLVLLEHPPIVTIGRFGSTENLLASQEEFKEQGVDIRRVERGGDITFHGPGQLVGYPILRLSDFNLVVKSYIYSLEETLIDLLSLFRIKGHIVHGYPGVWADEEKIAAIGVRIREGITMHGFALNVSTDLKYFSLIVPCGIQNKGVTSMEKILGRRINLEETGRIFAQKFGERLGVNMEERESL